MQWRRPSRGTGHHDADLVFSLTSCGPSTKMPAALELVKRRTGATAVYLGVSRIDAEASGHGGC
eukprot:scaffold1661_cov251-Pinguiococcus_pyrenoidosus.AAC.36